MLQMSGVFVYLHQAFLLQQLVGSAGCKLLAAGFGAIASVYMLMLCAPHKTV